MKKYVAMTAVIALAIGSSACSNPAREAAEAATAKKVIETFAPYCGPANEIGERKCLALAEFRLPGEQHTRLWIINGMRANGVLIRGGDIVLPEDAASPIAVEGLSNGEPCSLSERFIDNGDIKGC